MKHFKDKPQRISSKETYQGTESQQIPWTSFLESLFEVGKHVHVLKDKKTSWFK